jgi:hypothetical protein
MMLPTPYQWHSSNSNFTTAVSPTPSTKNKVNNYINYNQPVSTICTIRDTAHYNLHAA